MLLLTPLHIQSLLSKFRSTYFFSYYLPNLHKTLRRVIRSTVDGSEFEGSDEAIDDEEFSSVPLESAQDALIRGGKSFLSSASKIIQDSFIPDKRRSGTATPAYAAKPTNGSTGITPSAMPSNHSSTESLHARAESGVTSDDSAAGGEAVRSFYLIFYHHFLSTFYVCLCMCFLKLISIHALKFHLQVLVSKPSSGNSHAGTILSLHITLLMFKNLIEILIPFLFHFLL